MKELSKVEGFLYIDTSKKDFINSNPILKKHFSKDIFKRKPKRLNSPLAKKLENPRHRLTEFYYSLKDNIERILELDEFDDHRKMRYLAMYDGICKISDSQYKNYEISKLYAEIKEAIEYFIGQEENPIQDLPIEAQICKNKILGANQFEK